MEICKVGHFPEAEQAGGETDHQQVGWSVEHGASDFSVVLVEVVAFVNPPTRPCDGNANIA